MRGVHIPRTDNGTSKRVERSVVRLEATATESRYGRSDNATERFSKSLEVSVVVNGTAVATTPVIVVVVVGPGATGATVIAVVVIVGTRVGGTANWATLVVDRRNGCEVLHKGVNLTVKNMPEVMCTYSGNAEYSIECVSLGTSLNGSGGGGSGSLCTQILRGLVSTAGIGQLITHSP